MTEDLKPTEEQSKAFQAMHDFFNAELFEGKLSRPMIVPSRNKNVTCGYFSPNKWKDENDGRAHEIGLNANVMADGDLLDTYRTMLHEMVHQWQHEFGKPGRPGYHNIEWGTKMVEIGLQPICLDGPEPEEKLCGQSMNDRFIEGGRAELIIASMPQETDLPWYTDEKIMIDGNGLPVPVPSKPGSGSKPSDGDKPASGKRTKYTCATCGLNAWARFNASLICGECNRPMVALV